MDKLVLNSTATAAWQTLIADAQSVSAQPLNETCESYLVFLLMRYMANSQIANSVLAIDYLESQQYTPMNGRRDKLQAVGDKCLLFAGLFPERARKKRVKNTYFIQLGQGAYTALADMRQRSVAELYAELSKEFTRLIDVLRATRALSPHSPHLDAFTALERWHDTKSQHALNQLRNYTSSPHSFIHINQDDDDDKTLLS